MAKRAIAVTNIKHNGADITAGDPLNTEDFSKEELRSLYDSGAVRIEDAEDAKGPDTAAPEAPQAAETPAVEAPKSATVEEPKAAKK